MGRSKKLTYDYVKNFIEIESDSSCLLLSNQCENAHSKIKILCKCGTEFETDFNKFKSRNKRQCNACSLENVKNALKFDYEYVKEFIESNSKCKLISLEYKSNCTNLDIKCKCGNMFQTTFERFKNQNKRHCKECGKLLMRNFKLLDYYKVKNYIEVESNSGCLLNSKQYEGYFQPLDIQCSCGRSYTTTFASFKNSNTIRCRLCSNKTSIPEVNTGNILDKMNYCFEMQYMFKDCRNKKPLRFDIAIFKNSNKTKLLCLLELDGKQHFEPIHFGGISSDRALNKMEIAQHCDSIKTQYCLDHNIPLLRIPYWDFDNIETILEQELKKYNLIT